MYGYRRERSVGVPLDVPVAARSRRDRVVHLFLPNPVSDVHALAVILFGFALEGVTEVYQFLQRGSLAQGPLVYYTTLATTILGFYLMFLGFREWHAFHPKPARRKKIPWLLIQLFGNAFLRIGLWLGLHSKRLRRKYLVPWMLAMVACTAALVVSTIMIDRANAIPQKRRWPVLALALLAGGTGMTAVLSLSLGNAGAQTAPFWIVWPVGGLIVLLIGNFFFGLRKQATYLGSPVGNALGWMAVTWSLGVATVAGLVVGDRAVVLLTEFFTNWGALVTSVAPIVVAMSPLFVAYALIIGAFYPALRSLRSGTSSIPIPT
jgi:hypothetical protein